jgi:hypothetical protein
MDARARKLSIRYGWASAGVAFLFGSLPLLDEVVVVPVHYTLIVRLARMRRFPLRRLPWRQLQRIVWYGAGARTALGLSLTLIPLAGAVANWVTAIALTEYLAQYLDEAMSHPERPAPEITRAQLVRLFEKARAERGKPAGGAVPAG